MLAIQHILLIAYLILITYINIYIYIFFFGGGEGVLLAYFIIDYINISLHINNIQGTPIYKAGNHYPIFFCLHGAGDSAQSFACLAGEVKKFATLISFDFRGHGEN